MRTQQCNVLDEHIKKSSLLNISNTSYFNYLAKLCLFSMKNIATSLAQSINMLFWFLSSTTDNISVNIYLAFLTKLA